MKRFFLVAMLLISGVALSQDKVTWKVSYNAEKQHVEFHAHIADGWHLYSQHIQNDIGPVPTTFVFNENTAVKWESAVAEPQPIHEYDENFEASLDFFKNEVVFTRRIAAGSKGKVSGYVTYMVCNEIMCLPPVDYEFSITIP